MISEPELVGGAPEEDPAPDRRPAGAPGSGRFEPEAPGTGRSGPEVPGPRRSGPEPGGPERGGPIAGPPPPPAGPPDRRPGRRPWLWALGGAALASALWAGAFLRYVPQDHPDQDGYRSADGELCALAELRSLSLALGRKRSTSGAEDTRHEALDQSYCSRSYARSGDGSPSAPTAPSYSVDLYYELHKRTDPAPEFEPRLIKGPFAAEPEWSPLAGLGDRAFFRAQEGRAELFVLDGPAVLELTVSQEMAYDAKGEPLLGDQRDLAPLRPDMVTDLRTLMTRLRT
ncbi:hypothetical protein NX801_02255 [Streptomyces sp. LP05-1]|uniref:Uncharacterized protein n=1 Tax=Streptomyces pyxinae TaxID=2970734 RepID=A0ABT2CD01_9ACTN|nr:hypothetical protein [Streptomyces sp. LP05-1]MCS0634504.1 hypothetical protein [Streptomyces sp. LP05-1]